MESSIAVIPIWVIIVSSAGVGALVSSLIGLLSQSLERRARRHELLLSKSIDLAVARTETAMQTAMATGAAAHLQDNIVSVEGYYHWLKHLMKHGALPNDPRIQRLSDRR